MKKTVIFVAMLITCGFVFATINEFYSFNETTGTYSAITGTAVTDMLSDNGLSAPISIGFNFPYGDNTYSQIKISANGGINIGTNLSFFTYANSLASTNYVPVVAALWDDCSMEGCSCAYLLSDEAPQRIFTIQYTNLKWNYNSSGRFNFQIRLYETGKIDIFYGPSTGAPNVPEASIGINMLPGGSGWFYSVTPGSPATVSSTVPNNSISTYPGNGTIYEFNPVSPHSDDLAALGISGNSSPSVGQLLNYTITVRNRGTNTQSNYQVKLYRDNGIELNSVAGSTIAYNQTLTVNVPWIPQTAGPAILYGKVVLEGDEYPQNNQTANLSVNVQPQNIVTVTIGAGNQTEHMPVDMFHQNSLFETIYLASEINCGGTINALQFYNNFVTDIPPKPTNIWMGETTQTNLSAGWIPADQLYQVYSGSINYPNGINDVLINLTTPYIYSGGNLVVMIERVMDTHWYPSANVFLTQTGTIENRTRFALSDYIDYDPVHPPAVTPRADFPKTSIMIGILNLGAVSGTIYTSDNIPLEGATVTVIGTNLICTTSSTGTFLFPYVPVGNHQIKATKHNYSDVINTVTVVENQTVTTNIILPLLPLVTVSGRIVGSDNPAIGISNATIKLKGYAEYQAITDQSGYFTIPNVYANHTYSYQTFANGYQNSVGTIVLTNTNLNMGDIIVNEWCFPPEQIEAVEAIDWSNVTLSWQPPNPHPQTVTEDFEEPVFPPEGWTRIITDDALPGNSFGVYPTWCHIGYVDLPVPAVPPSGSYQAGLWWDVHHQDEWLITPLFICPENASLTFWTYVLYGSQWGDHYYVKVSTDNGNTWQVLWDASPLTGGWNCYTSPIVLNLSDYVGQQIKIAWQAKEPDGSTGIFYVWFIDDITISNGTQVLTFPASELVYNSKPNIKKTAVPEICHPDLPASKALFMNPNLIEPYLEVANAEKSERVPTGYQIYRLLATDQDNETLWTYLTTSSVTNYTDTNWSPLPTGDYKYALKTIYTNDIISSAAFSNVISKGMTGIFTGTVTDGNTNQPIEGASVNAGEYRGYTNAQGVFSIGLLAGNYTVSCTKYGYKSVLQTGVNIPALQITTLNFTLSDAVIAPDSVLATEINAGSSVLVTWNVPNPSNVGEWIHYDDGIHFESVGIGSGNAAVFDVAIRYPVADLQSYIGYSLYAVKVWIFTPGSFSLRVWTGGNAQAPGTLIVDQPFNPLLSNYQTILLNNPVPITGTEEIWFGYHCDIAGGYPAGCDDGPAIDGLGNLIYLNGAWTTLLTLNSDLNYNWNIQGYIGYTSPIRATLRNNILAPNFIGSPKNANRDRSFVGYNIYRFLISDQEDESQWLQLNTEPLPMNEYIDNTWATIPGGIYQYAIKTVYSNNVVSAAAFSNELPTGSLGSLTGIVIDNGTNLPLEGAQISVGENIVFTNEQGVYSLELYQGIYTVNCSKHGYETATQTGVHIIELQTTTLNFNLLETILPPNSVTAVEANSSQVNISWIAPGQGSITEGFEGTVFPPENWDQIITNTSAAGVSGILPTWCQAGTIALDPVVPPHGGSFQSAIWWSNAHQDEWLITPQFFCTANSVLQFWSYVYLGSTYNDHYNVKVSTDNGTTWTVIWDATAETGGWNHYDTPISIDLSSYIGQDIKLAWQADDPPTNDGIWYVWFIDDILIGTPTNVTRFKAEELLSYNRATNCIPKPVYTPLPASREVINQKGLKGMDNVRSLIPIAQRNTYPLYDRERVVIGYQVWRFLQGQETNESAWNLLTDTPIDTLMYTDANWSSLPDGTYKWAVKAIYSGNIYSEATISNALTLNHEVGIITGFVRNMQNQPISGATVTCENMSVTTNTNGTYIMSVPSGIYDVTASHPNYQSVSQTGIIVVTGETTTVNFQLPPTTDIFSDSFEIYPNFAITFAPWTLVDVDQSDTYYIDGYTWANAGSPQAYIIFNPSATTPAITSLSAHSGNKLACSFAAVMPAGGGSGPNNDWMITPQLSNTNSIKFWAKSYTSQYGLERFKVGISPSTNPADFTIISGANYIEAPVDWTEYTYQINQAGPLYIGIQCVSNDAFIFCVDDVTVTGGDANDPEVPVVATALHNNYPNPFNPETTISYSVKEAGPVTLQVYNVKGQLVKTLIKGIQEPGNHTIVWNGTDNNGRTVSSGVYYYKMQAGKYHSTKKMIMMK